MSIAACGSNQFTCDNECLELSRRCDKIRDCLDRSDEENCGYSSNVSSDFDRIARLSLFIAIGTIGLVLLIVIFVVFIICMRRNKRRQLASVQIIQVPAHYIKTRDGVVHSSSAASVASGPCNNSAMLYHCNSGSGNPLTQQLVAGQQPNMDSHPDDLVTARSHRSHSRHSSRSRRSTSSGRHHRRTRHVAVDDGSGLMQPPSVALSGDSSSGFGTTGAATGSTTVSTSGVIAAAASRPSSMHCNLQQHEAIYPMSNAFRHSFHGNLDTPPLRHDGTDNHLQDSAPQLAASNATGTTTSSTTEHSPPPPYSTFDRTVFPGRLETSASGNETLNQQQTPIFANNNCTERRGLNSALMKVENNILYGDAANFSSQQRPSFQPQQQPPRVSPYTREWIERVSSSRNDQTSSVMMMGNSNISITSTPQAAAPLAAQPADTSPLQYDTLLHEQSYAQQIRQALRKNQSARSIQATSPPRPESNANESNSNVRMSTQTPQSMASGYLNMSSSTPFTITPSPTRVITPQYSHIVRKPAVAISKRPMPLNV